MSEKNTGIEYERIIQEIYTQILKQENVKNIEVKHNVIIKGKTVDHQIDVYWEFEIAGIKYKTIVQAKDWNSAVKLGDILTFASVIDDIPGNPHGVYITKTGYQKGAKEYATAHGISLYELREPTEEDWEGKMRNIELNFLLRVPIYGKMAINVDREWALENLIDIRKFEAISGYINADTPLFDENHNIITSISQIMHSYTNTISDTDKHFIEHEFTDAIFFDTGIDNTFLKLKAIGFEVQIRHSTYTHKIVGDDIVKYILKNTITQKTRTIGNDLKPISKD